MKGILGGECLGKSRRLLKKLWSELRSLASAIPHYSELHRIANFAGNLEHLKATYATSSSETKVKLSRQFDSIVDQLTMANGVTKETYANRLEPSLSAVLSAVPLSRSEIRVLDLPASTGAASLRSLAQLQERYRVTSYVLADKYQTILYDRARQCIYDEAENLLQVGFKLLFFSLHRVGTAGDRYTPVMKALALPHSVMAWFLRKRYPFRASDMYRRLLVVHPEAEQLLDRGVFHLQEMDVFQPISGRYDLILSFHLLNLWYFQEDAITTGIKNLAASLSDGGLLVVGNSESFVAFQKQGGSLVPRLREGNWQSLGIARCCLIA